MNYLLKQKLVWGGNCRICNAGQPANNVFHIRTKRFSDLKPQAGQKPNMLFTIASAQQVRFADGKKCHFCILQKQSGNWPERCFSIPEAIFVAQLAKQAPPRGARNRHVAFIQAACRIHTRIANSGVAAWVL
ncbi:hypothetical protein [Alteraurantiacibacter aquimixticola]|uniref:Uncharacterized protein n=1 Tax=Alteraurantiacibacter aquimixticola TaxID=2489173 RepID=A0A4T3F310_9SPHN|nr:hypothetical protein [Alteraurantiacibacter aquimixticola]TIX50695.1 hypothetical protein E5222_10625 [Alteraurantiacibacter aquimixticola]